MRFPKYLIFFSFMLFIKICVLLSRRSARERSIKGLESHVCILFFIELLICVNDFYTPSLYFDGDFELS